MDGLESFLQDSQGFSLGDGVDDEQLEMAMLEAMNEAAGNATHSAATAANTVATPAEFPVEDRAPAFDDYSGMTRSLVEIEQALEQKLTVFDAHLLTLERQKEKIQSMIDTLDIMTQRSFHSTRLANPFVGSFSSQNPHLTTTFPMDYSAHFITPPYVCGSEVSGMHNNGGNGQNPNTSSSASRGKEVTSTTYFDRALFDVVAPNSPEEDGRPPPHPQRVSTTGLNPAGDGMAAVSLNPIPVFSLGIPKLPGGLDSFVLPAFTQAESDSVMTGLFSSTPPPRVHETVPRAEGPVVDTSWMLNLSTLNQRGKSLKQHGGGRKRKAGPAIDAITPTIPLTFPMVFRPTMEMGLTIHQRKLAAYVFGDNLNFK
ncbi:hypothetical protein PIB30_061663 [Stylosanthes scabra]|uniref:Uncharacterized protein n=1 Tax=Stylosanthes scabra TaxID=79078 RepID=A0ABU6TLI7_9FABA|nr:hypothetical protein [Stylosanthes scabra]